MTDRVISDDDLDAIIKMLIVDVGFEFLRAETAAPFRTHADEHKFVMTAALRGVIENGWLIPAANLTELIYDEGYTLTRHREREGGTDGVRTPD